MTVMFPTAASVVSLAVLSLGLHDPEWSALHPPQSTKHREAEITHVPGYTSNHLPSKHYGGYITVDQDHGRHLYYYFVTSERSPSSDPVVLWLNGGPGCSSFDGFVYEHGPFKFGFKGGKDSTGREKQQLELTHNPHSWSKVANMLYVDSPAGVGMSYSETKADYRTNDTRTAADMDTFLRRWFQEYAEFQGNDFFVSGESFAGVYVPLVTQAVVRGNEEGEEPKLNIKGYIVGNGVTDPRFDGDALVPFAHGKSLISTQQYDDARHTCGGSYWNASSGSPCDKALFDIWAGVSGLNIYGILSPCYHGHNPYKQAQQPRQQASVQEAVLSVRQWPLLGGAKPGEVPGFLGMGLGHTPPCLDSREMWAFCNSEEVRAAIHAQPMAKIGGFDECTNGGKIHYTHEVESVIPVHKDLLDRGLRALIYSGDHDMAVPHTGSEAWTASLGLPVSQPWRAWLTEDEQVAGYAVHYRGLIYATIKGAGHMVPEDKPQEALAMFGRFLKHGRL